MKIARVRKLLPRLKIRNKASEIVGFVPNPCQERVLDAIAKLEDENRPPWLIVLKSRQVGISTLAAGLLTAHCVSVPNAQAKIIAHLSDSSSELFGRAKMMLKSIPCGDPGERPEPTSWRAIYPHKAGDSILQRATAGATAGGRGQTLSACHFSECAFYNMTKGSFTSILPSIAHTPNSLVIIESTANGRIDDGQDFYEAWLSAVEGRGEFTPIFIPWTEDPECVADAKLADDAPADSDEEELMNAGVSVEQIAWRRWCLETKCHSDPIQFNQEYPIDDQVAFRTTGNPAFGQPHIQAAKKFVREPLLVGTMKESPDGSYSVLHDRHGISFWEEPQIGQQYYIGVDVARGTEQDVGSRNTDFSAFIGWNGTTGELAFRYDGKITPEPLADMLNLIGRYYNNAMINIELTGNLGIWTQKRMRDVLTYPNLYVWKGARDDAMMGRNKRSSYGWETTGRSREMLFTSFREALTSGRILNKDKKVVIQMDHATREQGWRWQVTKGHDDVLFCFAPETMVETSSGRRAIATIRPGDHVRSSIGEDATVLATSSRCIEESIFEISVMGSNRKILSTWNHPIRACRYEWRKRKTKTRKKVLVNSPAWVMASNLSIGDYVFVSKRRGLRLSSFNEDQLWVMGWYLAEGWVSKRPGTHNVEFCLHRNEMEIAEKICEVLKKYSPDRSPRGGLGNRIYKSLDPRIKKIGNTNAIAITFSSRYWHSLFLEHCGRGSAGKLLSPELYNSSGLVPLVLGYIGGDGCQSQGCGRHHVQVSSKSEALIYQIRQILIDEGIWSTVSRPKRQNIVTLNMTPEFFHKLPDGYKTHRVERTFEKRHVIPVEDGFWTPVKSVFEKKYHGDVVNLEISGDKTFIAEGIGVHNSAMLGWIAIEQYPPARLLPAMCLLDRGEDRPKHIGRYRILDDVSMSLITHYNSVMKPKRENPWTKRG